MLLPMGHCRIAWYSATNPWNSCCVQPCLRRQRALRWGAAYDRHLCCNLPANSDIDIDLLRWIKTYGITLCNMHQRVIMQLSVCMNVFLMNVALCMHGCMHGCVDVGINNLYILIFSDCFAQKVASYLVSSPISSSSWLSLHAANHGHYLPK